MLRRKVETWVSNFENEYRIYYPLAGTRHSVETYPQNVFASCQRRIFMGCHRKPVDRRSVGVDNSPVVTSHKSVITC
ncbi:MAG: hypothetical protein LBD27_06420, partial [Tannerella sp.]|nr:hypothetical protein [Tannerella sp.]